MKQPSAEQVRAARQKVGLTQAKAAEVIHVTVKAWAAWEQGANNMPLACWELFHIKMGIRPDPRGKK